MDPLNPITPASPSVAQRRVPPVDRLRRISREGDRPEREDAESEGERRRRPDEPAEGEGGDGHIDIRV